MDAIILDKNLRKVANYDLYNSFIWTDRYNEAGDFELETSDVIGGLQVFQPDYFIIIKETDHVMVIEDREINTDSDSGNTLKVTGRSLESILDRRIVWEQTIIKGNVQNGIEKLLNDAIIKPTVANRKINNFIFKRNNDKRITDLEMETQLLGETLYDAITSICATFEIGFKMTINDNYQIIFELYIGENRTYSQIKNPYVIFSPRFDNLIDSNYVEVNSSDKTITMILGEGDGNSRKRTTFSFEGFADKSGIDRKEMYTDAGDISKDTGEQILSDQEYINQLKQRGKEELVENIKTTAFDGGVETSSMFIFNKDYFTGDIIQIENEYGLESVSRVVEVILSDDSSGFSISPTFSAIE